MIQRVSVTVVRRLMFVRLLLVGFFIGLVGLIATADTGSLPWLWGPVYAVPFGDKIGHFLLMGIFSFLANVSLNGRLVHWRGRSMMLGTLIVFVLVGGEELSQAFIATRSCDAADFAADTLGILLGAMAAKSFLKARAKQVVAA